MIDQMVTRNFHFCCRAAKLYKPQAGSGLKVCRLKLAQGSNWLKVQGSSWLKAQVGSRFKAQGSRSKTTWQLNCVCFDDQNGY